MQFVGNAGIASRALKSGRLLWRAWLGGAKKSLFEDQRAARDADVDADHAVVVFVVVGGGATLSDKREVYLRRDASQRRGIERF